MPNLSLADFVERVSEIMPVVMREFFRQETNEFYKLKITLPQFVVLDMLKRQGESKMSDLARLINVTTAAMTGIVDRLVRDGYAKRMHDPGDRRIVKVDLTVKGARSVKDMTEHRKMLMARIFEMISQKEREEYLMILTHIRDHIMEKSH
ncbi:MAG: MarR family transcriptional regulator [Candidatus Omnitrophica bacterium]|nr:MarR family transcriptional regulator [Candidatus Omnitrophota bacterium]